MISFATYSSSVLEILVNYELNSYRYNTEKMNFNRCDQFGFMSIFSAIFQSEIRTGISSIAGESFVEFDKN